MSEAVKPQSFSSHARFVPGFHFIAGSATIIVFIWALYRLATIRTSAQLLTAMIAFILVAQFWYLRAFPIAVQDRLIRLEERLRLARLLPPELQSASEQLTAEQLIALRFASDAELPGLTKKVIDEKITTRAAIKALVTDWRADHMRV